MEDWDGDRIELYNLNPFGGLEDHGESMIVPSKRCEKCGKWMTPRMHNMNETTLYYTCDCEKTAAETEATPGSETSNVSLCLTLLVVTESLPSDL